MAKHKIAVLCGPGGVGKSTIEQFLTQNLSEEFKKVVTCTSRPMRDGEEDGKNYYFLTEEEFMKKVNNNEFIEYNRFGNGYLYGTLYAEVLSILEKCNCIMSLDPETTAKIRENEFFKKNKTHTFFLNADEAIIKRRLKKRGANKEEITLRLSIAKKEREFAKFCDHRVFVKNPYYASNRVYKLLTGKKLEI